MDCPAVKSNPVKGVLGIIKQFSKYNSKGKAIYWIARADGEPWGPGRTHPRLENKEASFCEAYFTLVKYSETDFKSILEQIVAELKGLTESP